ncbi:phosphate signaling complex protein PhoU [Candidatus Igneacidithiobacillus taiwanensis]|uniref:phosphate signaling complex protein PhoU n=1 Tax=Candidatus Igneacidithiobacillus taiwanensis TaxID=1945924 RepID=UPI00289A3E0F|nr:phosphate signaling complex protein PhoU [Candidatus Igneacidithiobacillus taiwanensis]
MLNTDPHVSHRFDDELNAVHELVHRMAGVVEEQMRNALSALLHQDEALANEIIGRDSVVNDYELRIEEECINILVRRHPAASDLRLVMTLIKSIADLERIGDKAVKIASMSLSMQRSSASVNNRFLRDIKVMGDYALGMFRKAMDALANNDAEAAVEIAKGDEELNQEYRAAMRRLITYMMEDPRTITPAIDALFVAKALERVGDHARNLCEYVIYLVKGVNVRHIPLEDVGKQLQD